MSRHSMTPRLRSEQYSLHLHRIATCNPTSNAARHLLYLLSATGSSCPHEPRHTSIKTRSLPMPYV